MFLLRRNLPRAYAWWHDEFERPPENPVKWPWVHLGDGTPSAINSLGELQVFQNATTTNGGGASYEFMPFTPNWGFETEFFWPVGGLAAQSLDFMFTNTWADIGAAFVNCVGVRFFYRTAPLASNIYIAEYPAVIAIGTLLGTYDTPAAFGGQLTLRVWVEDDQWMRVWINGIYVGSRTVEPGFKLGPGRRCIRILNGSYADAYLRWVSHFDRPASIPPDEVWQSDFYDDFNGRSGNQNGVNGWTQLGTNAAVVSDSWATTGTTDGSRGLIRDTGNTSGRMRIEATVGGASGINNTADSGLVLCSNSAGTQGLSANIFGNKIYLSEFSSSLNGSPTFSDQTSMTTGITVNTGDKVAFSVYNGIAWIEVAGQRRLYSGTANATVPATNSWAGLRVERASSNNSCSWNDVRIFSGLST